jgi:hypothetical protein
MKLKVKEIIIVIMKMKHRVRETDMMKVNRINTMLHCNCNIKAFEKILQSVGPQGPIVEREFPDIGFPPVRGFSFLHVR